MKKPFLLFALLILISLFYLNNLYFTINSTSAKEYKELSSSFLSSNKETLSLPSFTCSFSASEMEVFSLIEKLSVQVIDTQTIEGRTIIYGYSPRFSSSVPYKDAKVNIQIVLYNNVVTLGCPLIYDSY